MDASVRIAASDRLGLERICRYGARPPFSADRLVKEGPDTLVYCPPKPGPDGRPYLVMTPLELHALKDSCRSFLAGHFRRTQPSSIFQILPQGTVCGVGMPQGSLKIPPSIPAPLQIEQTPAAPAAGFLDQIPILRRQQLQRPGKGLGGPQILLLLI